MMNRLVQLLLIILFCFTLIGCREIQVPEVIDVRSDMVRKIEFARDMRFYSTLGSDFEWLLDVDREIEVIFVAFPESEVPMRDWSVFNPENPPSKVYFWNTFETSTIEWWMFIFVQKLNIDLADFNLSVSENFSTSEWRNGIRINLSSRHCNWEDVDNLWRSFDPSVQEIIQARVGMSPILRYARGMRLINNTINFDLDAEVPLAPFSAPEIIFVHNEEEALALFPGRDWSVYDNIENPPETVILWPDEDQSQGAINGLNWHIRRNDINIEEFSLEYPITLADLVDNLEKVILAWETLSATRQDTIRRDAIRHGANAFVFVETQDRTG